MLRVILLKIYMVWVILVFTTFMIVLLPFIVIPILIHPDIAPITFYTLHLWSWLFSKFNFISYEILGKNNINSKNSYIYTCNHTSFLDAPGIAMAIPNQFRPLAKKELAKIPIFGLIVKVVTIVVDRSNQQSRKKSMELLKRIIQKRISILIFPEGTQNRTKEILQPFYSGAFKIAVESQTPVVPIAIINAGKLMPPGTLNIRPGKIKVVIGKPIITKGLTLNDVSKIKDDTFEAMKDLIINHPV